MRLEMRCFPSDVGLPVLAFTTGCYEIPCNPVPVPAVEVHLESAADGSAIIGALGEVRDGHYRDSFVDLNDGWYMAANDRPGTYVVHMESRGYAPLDTSAHASDFGRSCPNIATARIEARLEPAHLEPVPHKFRQ